MSCAKGGRLQRRGYYSDGAFNQQAFVVIEVKGVWGKAEEVPGTAALNKGGSASINSVSCASADRCSAVGGYIGHNAVQVFVVSETKGT